MKNVFWLTTLLVTAALLWPTQGQPPAPQAPLLRVDLGGTAILELVPLKPGTVRMGSAQQSADAYGDEKPQHQVTLTRTFHMGKYEVTRGQFQQFVAATDYRTEAEKDGQGGWGVKQTLFKQGPQYTWRNPGFEQTDAHPVVNVSWNDAQAFVEWLSAKTGQTYRLPTEAEWEYACRAGTQTRYFSGDASGSLRGLANVADQTAQQTFPHWALLFDFADGYVFTAPVGKFRPNPWGLYDMAGNVWEWCHDWFDEHAYRRGDCTDPLGPATGVARVYRGGAWHGVVGDARCAARFSSLPHGRGNGLGFRVVRIP